MNKIGHKSGCVVMNCSGCGGDFYSEDHSRVYPVPFNGRHTGQIALAINAIGDHIHELNHKWWIDPRTGEPKDRNFGEMIALCHSELSEALEGHRKNLMDDHLPDRPMVEVELADAMIRIFDTARGLGYDLGGAIAEKCQYNLRRADHQHEARLAEGGKEY